MNDAELLLNVFSVPVTCHLKKHGTSYFEKKSLNRRILNEMK
jgi:hypothetical protein